MAWDAYSQSIRDMTFKAGGIFDLQGNPWTSFCDDGSLQFDSVAQVPNIVKVIAEGPGSETKVFVNGQKQQVIIGDEDCLVGKYKNDSSIVAVKCKQCVLVGIGGAQSEPRHLRGKLETLAAHVKNSGY